MDTDRLATLLAEVRDGSVAIDDALDQLKRLPFETVEGHARLDTHRALRTGAAEVVFCPGKSPDQVASIMKRLVELSGRAMASRATREQYDAVKAVAPDAVYNDLAQMILIGAPIPAPHPDRYVGVLTAGTADIRVGEEAALVLEWQGTRAERLYDVGVAGLHRLLSQLDVVQKADVLIVVAGMEGALASVAAGLVSCPVVAVPTSIGYGASLGGFAPLLTMLNSCAGGIAVVNIDNGFGAAQFAHRIVSGQAARSKD
ncbi:MAG: nickel pincer cofactor biosynthesis protein LarB [Capsulimonadaceae bacterium]|nr:nickel pincer cofactor biosynthesis protein LarB [Capsulimonadaceae bacterium]